MWEVHDLLVSTGGASPRLQAILRAWATYLRANLSESGQAAATGMTVDMVRTTRMGRRPSARARFRASHRPRHQRRARRSGLHPPPTHLSGLVWPQFGGSHGAGSHDRPSGGSSPYNEEVLPGPTQPPLQHTSCGTGPCSLHFESELALGSAAIFDPSTVRLTGASFAMSPAAHGPRVHRSGRHPRRLPRRSCRGRAGWLAGGGSGESSGHRARMVDEIVPPLSGTTRSIDFSGLEQHQGGRQASRDRWDHAGRAFRTWQGQPVQKPNSSCRRTCRPRRRYPSPGRLGRRSRSGAPSSTAS